MLIFDLKTIFSLLDDEILSKFKMNIGLYIWSNI